jgi:DNA polymerase I-like protein with 3'-5' exonuclease and polymerase domains
MIEINEFRLPITPEQGRNILQEHTDVFGCFFDLDKILEYESMHALHIHKNIREWWELAGDPTLELTKNYDILRVLLERFNIPKYKLTFEGKLSIRSDEVLKPLLQDQELSQDAHRFVELCISLGHARYMRSYLKQYKDLPVCRLESFDNHRMVVGHPVWNVLSTSRISASKPSLQNMIGGCGDVYTAPKGYAIIFSDSSQIEPRITYSHFIKDDLLTKLITAYDDAYYGILHYIHLSDKEEEGLRADFSSLVMKEITPELKATRADLKVLALAGNYGSSNLQAVDPVLGPLYERRIVNHPDRLRFESEVRNKVRQGADTFHAAFGTPVKPEATNKYTKGGQGWYQHLIRCGINNPIQATASELMLFSLYEVQKVLSLYGFINYYKHDEGSFYVVEDKAEEIAPKLQECVSYKVKDWIPIGSDLRIGKKPSGHESLF